METDSQARTSRPSPWLLALLGVVGAVFLVTRMWSGSAAVPMTRSNQPRTPKKDETARIDPKDLKVRLEALEAAPQDQGDVERNPFRFQPRAAPAPAPGPGAAKPPESSEPVVTAPPVPSGPPPIPLKYMGSVEKPNGVKIAALSDCRAATYAAAEGEVVDGRYRVVKIGLESLVIEYIDGQGQQTLRKEGCPPR
jgi:hypothetical protein